MNIRNQIDALLDRAEPYQLRKVLRFLAAYIR